MEGWNGASRGRSLVQGRPHMDVGLTRRAGLVVVRCGACSGCRWSGQLHIKSTAGH